METKALPVSEIQMLNDTLLQLVDKSNAQFGIADVLIISFTIIGGVALLLFIYHRYILKGGKTGLTKNIADANEAHGVIIKKDPATGAYVILTIPQLLSSFTDVAKSIDKSMKKLGESTEKLANHNGDKLEAILKQLKERS